MKPTHQDIEDLLRHLVLPFHHVNRTMRLPVGEWRWENDAEHSWSLAFLACALAPEIDSALDVGKISQFAIVHDIIEVYADDTSISIFDTDEHIQSKETREEAAWRHIKKKFAHFSWIIHTFEQYNRKDSDEALFVYALDKYICCMYDYLDKGKLFRQHKTTLAEYSKSLEEHRKKAHRHPVVGKYYDKVRDLLAAHPEYFYPSATKTKKEDL